ncbi:AsmA-like C-terminal region-containing protein [Aliiroseovarius lamellibrachiae]|uniref:AsmA-like C-terminal region-containing protein n=1 Tax=Aliiroseovarius lamellibrachiae TaxID=1924933 RepID=UPI001BE11B34|nr:AsmA-like C-terminal region-containing protein [Aliiroseovarius lamellibrachiae]MBT2132604.1 hypothetical protein [Aliiroseovarius lamellibrachiae]
MSQGNKTDQTGKKPGKVPEDPLGSVDPILSTSVDVDEHLLPNLPKLTGADVPINAPPEEDLPEAEPIVQPPDTADAASFPLDDHVIVPGPDGPMCPIAARKARRRRRLKWHVSIWSILLILLAILFVVILSMSMTGRVVSLPNWMTERIEAGINAQTDRADLSLHRVDLGISPHGIPRLRLVDVGVRDLTGLEVARLNAVEGGLRLSDALRGNLKPAWLRLFGAQVTLRRRANGEFDLTFGTGGGATGDLASILDLIDSEFTNGSLADLQDISTEGLTITLEDARSGRLWQVTDGRMKVTHNDEAVDITVSFDVFNQTEELAETVLGFRAFKGRSGASLTATFKNARAVDIAAQSPVLAFLGVVDAPISGALHTVISDAGTIGDLAGTLEFGAGAVRPDPGVEPIEFEGGKVYLDYDPERERLDFTELSVTTDWGEARIEGQAYLRGWDAGWPTEMIGQLDLTSALINPPGVFEAPVALTGGGADFRLRLAPFTLEIGSLSVIQSDLRLTGSGRAAADARGWDAALQLHADKVLPEHVVAFWPIHKTTRTRDWIIKSVFDGQLTNATAAVRLLPGAKPDLSLTAEFSGMHAQVVKGMVPVKDVAGRLSIYNKQLVAAADTGHVQPEGHGAIDLAGTVFVIDDITQKPSPARVDLALRGDVPSALALLDKPPYRIFKTSKTIGADLARGGQFDLTGQVDLVLKPKLAPGEVRYDIAATLRDVVSEKLVPDHQLRLRRATVTAGNSGIELSGQGRLDSAPVTARWVQDLSSPDARGRSQVTGTVTLSDAALRDLNIIAPNGAVQGQAEARFQVDLAADNAPRLSLRSDLKGMGLSIGSLGWSKPKNSTGSLAVDAILSKPAQVTRLDVEAPGLSAQGKVYLSPGGGLDAAQFDRVQLGGWLDAPVTLTGRGAGQPLAISVTGGEVDMRRATLGSGTRGSVPGAVPISLILDRLVISSGITLTQFEGNFVQNNGTSGTFRARVGGGARIKGTAAPQANGTAFRISATDAGAVLRDAGVFKTAHEGQMELILTPGGGKGVYEGELKIKSVDIKNAPAMAELLSAVSVVGLLQQLGGKGISFTDVEARFRLDPDKVTIYRSSAAGHSMGISMDGYYHLGTGQMEMQGVVSPFFIVNSAGRLFARKGEGLIGFNYTLKGTPEAPDVGVNPLSLFTPGMFRDIFRRSPPPKPDQ